MRHLGRNITAARFCQFMFYQSMNESDNLISVSVNKEQSALRVSGVKKKKCVRACDPLDRHQESDSLNINRSNIGIYLHNTRDHSEITNRLLMKSYFSQSG